MHICKKCKQWVSAKTKNHVCGVKTKVNDYRSKNMGSTKPVSNSKLQAAPPQAAPPRPTYTPSYSTPTPKKTVTDDYNDGLDLLGNVALGIGIASLFGGSDDSSSSSDSSSDSSSSFDGFGGGDFGGGGSSGDW